MSYSPYADVTIGVANDNDPNDNVGRDNLEPGELDQIVRHNKMVTLLIKPIIQKKDLDFHSDDEFDDENLQTLIHFINGKFHHGLGDSAGSEMIQHAFKRGGKINNWDEFLTKLLAAIYGSMSENIDRIADSLED